MKRLLLPAIALALFLPATAFAQNATKPAETRADESKITEPKPDESRPTTKTTTISGKVSDDASTIITDNDVHWTVANPFMLASFAGQSATVKGHPYKGENKIQVLSATGILPNAKVVGNTDTSAYRR
jgi:hypothetical protein